MLQEIKLLFVLCCDLFTQGVLPMDPTEDDDGVGLPPAEEYPVELQWSHANEGKQFQSKTGNCSAL